MSNWQGLLNSASVLSQVDPLWEELVRNCELLLVQTEIESEPGDPAAISSFVSLIPEGNGYQIPGELLTRLFIRIGRYLGRVGEWKESELVFERATGIVQKNSRLQAIAWMELGEIYRKSGKISAAQECQETALNIADDHGLNVVRADAYNNLAITHVESGQLDLAENHLHQSLDWSETLNEKRLSGHAYNNLGVIRCIQGRFQESILSFTRAMTIRESMNDEKGIAETLHNMSMAYKDLAQYDNAESCLEKALERSEKNSDQYQTANILLTHAEIAFLRKDYVFALNLTQDLLARQLRLGDQPGMADSYRLMGSIYSEQGNHNEAAISLTKALDKFRQLQMLLGEAECLKAMGECLTNLDQCDEAKKAYLEASNIYHKLGNSSESSRLKELS